MVQCKVEGTELSDEQAVSLPEKEKPVVDSKGTKTGPSVEDERGEQGAHQSLIMDISLTETEANFKRKSFERHIKVQC